MDEIIRVILRVKGCLIFANFYPGDLCPGICEAPHELQDERSRGRRGERHSHEQLQRRSPFHGGDHRVRIKNVKMREKGENNSDCD